VREKKVQNRKRGFTLIELVITISILAILIGIAIPTYSAYTDRTQLKVALDQVAIDLRKAQSLAKASVTVYYVEFTANSSSYQIHNSSTTSGALKNGVVSKNSVSVGLETATSTREITSSSTVTIVLRSPKGNEWSILVNPAGKVETTP